MTGQSTTFNSDRRRVPYCLNSLATTRVHHANSRAAGGLLCYQLGQLQPSIRLWSNVTEPLCARTLPVTFAPVVNVIDVVASIFP